MRRARTGRRGKRTEVDSDLPLLPLMNIIIVLIPMLLLSAVFIEIRAIEMGQLRAPAGVTTTANEHLDLAIRVTETAYVLEGHGIAGAAIPRPAQGAPDAEAQRRLATALAAIAAQNPGEHDVRIVAGAHVRYEELVTLMDLARAAGLSQAALEGAGTEA